MDENKQNLDITPEEQIAEMEQTKEVNDDELREKLAGDLGIDSESEENQQLLERLIEREKANHERLSVAIQQKIKYRELANAKDTSANLKDIPKDKKSNIDSADKGIELIRAEIWNELEKRDLKSLGLPEEIEQEVKDLARVRNISVREASEQPYIKFRIDDLKREKSLLEATTKRSKKGEIRISDIDFSKPLDYEDFKDESGKFDTEKWDKAKAAKERFLSRQQSK